MCAFCSCAWNLHFSWFLLIDKRNGFLKATHTRPDTDYRALPENFYHLMFLSSDRYQMPTYRVAHVLCYISVSISPFHLLSRNLRKNVHLFTISPHIIDINKRTSVCLLCTSGFRLGDGLSSQKTPQTCIPRHVAFFAICTHRRTMAYVGTSLRIGASRLPCTPTSGRVWYRFRVDISRQVDEVLTVIHSLMVMDVTKWLA